MKRPKKSFVLRLDDATFSALEKWAADDFRSINGQLEWVISAALGANGRLPGKRKREENTSKDEHGL
ncbi:MAG: hypothetical protein RIQ78_1451 [Bacteroidota bacterium]|jgi:hypothetical protein